MLPFFIHVRSLIGYARQGSSAISLLSELLKLDWRKRINAIDALNHPYFKNYPLPARPADLPTFEDSHELDRRNARGQKPAPPPAPAGGTVGLDFKEEWSSQAYSEAPRYDGDGRSYGARNRPQNNRNTESGPPARRYDSHGPPSQERRPRNYAGYQGHVPHRPQWPPVSNNYYDSPSSNQMQQQSAYDYPKDGRRNKNVYGESSRDRYSSSVCLGCSPSFLLVDLICSFTLA